LFGEAGLAEDGWARLGTQDKGAWGERTQGEEELHG